MSSTQAIRTLQEAVWKGSLPLQIKLSPADSRSYDKTDPYYAHVPRLSYLPFLLPQLHGFFTPFLIDDSIPASSAWFSFEGVPLKWHHPVGLLYDLFSGASPHLLPSERYGGHAGPKIESSRPLPWRLLIHYSEFPTDQLVMLDEEGRALHDAFINSVKEADFLRNGTANAIMKLSKDDSTALWESVRDQNLTTFALIYNRLVPASSSLRHIPLRVYLPSAVAAVTSPPASPKPSSPNPGNPESASASPAPGPKPAAPSAHLKVVQSLIPPFVASSREPQSLGAVLNSILPSLFPSRRRTVLARPVLHGAEVPMTANVEELMRGAAYADGWISLGVEMIIE